MTLATRDFTAAAAAPRGTVTLGATAGRVLLVLAVMASAAAGAIAVDPASAARASQVAGPELARLLRAMAALKVLLAVPVVGAVLWRLGAPASPLRLAAYAVASGAMAAGPGLIWSLAQVKLGALLLHGGLLATVILLWRDPAMRLRLSAAVARRRAALAGRPTPPR